MNKKQASERAKKNNKLLMLGIAVGWVLLLAVALQFLVVTITVANEHFEEAKKIKEESSSILSKYEYVVPFRKEKRH